MWPWMADWYDENEPARPYAPNIWAEFQGPCPQADLDTILHRFPLDLEDNVGHDWVSFDEGVRHDMEVQETLENRITPPPHTVTPEPSRPHI